MGILVTGFLVGGFLYFLGWAMEHDERMKTASQEERLKSKLKLLVGTVGAYFIVVLLWQALVVEGWFNGWFPTP